jgi:hypothetical protein
MLEEAAHVVAAPFWSTIAAQEDPRQRQEMAFLRTVFPSLLITGPFSIVLGLDGGIMALNDRLLNMYREHGFGDKIVIVGGDYNQRLTQAIRLVDELLTGIRP